MFKKFFSRFLSARTPEAEMAPPQLAESGRGVNPRRRRRRNQKQTYGSQPRPDAAQQATQEPGSNQAITDTPHRRRRKSSRGHRPNQPSSHDANDRRFQGASENRKPRERQGENSTQKIKPSNTIAGPQPRTSYFGNLRISKPVASALAEMGYKNPTHIQAEVIGPMLGGQDLVGQAQTGTGKTAGFGIPLAEKIDGNLSHVQAVVLVPTRELAQQVTTELISIFKYREITTVAVFGGAPISQQITQLDGGAQMVVGTPGRVIDLLNRGNLRLDKVGTVVLDEADQMLDIGFLPDIRTILRQTPRNRQTALFTATVPTQIRRLIYSYLNNPQTIRVGEESETAANVRQMYCEVARRDKLDALKEVFETIDAGEQTLVFRRTQEDVDWLVHMLKQRQMPADAIHGGLRQGERNAVMQSFRDGKLKILVSTNLTSRGIDVPAVAHVINYDCPEQVEEYVHRIGRTARMGRDGTAVTFVGEWDTEFFDAIRAHVGETNLEPINLTMYGDPSRRFPEAPDAID